MRPAITLVLVISLIGCRGSDTARPVDNIELRAAGLDLWVNSEGEGHYVAGSVSPTRTTSFKISPSDFKRLLERLAPFRAQAGPTDKVAREFVACPKGAPYVTDNGMVSVRWQGKALDQFYAVDLGCDRERNASRNAQLRAVLKSLPVPDPALLP